MLFKRSQLTIAVLIATFSSTGIWAQDVQQSPDSTLSQQPTVAPTQNSSLHERIADASAPSTSTAEPALLTILAPNSAANDSLPEQTSIISIESAPKDATPLLKAADSLGNPQQDLWARIRVGFSLAELDTGLVADNTDWYAKRPEYVSRMLERSKRYLFYIVEAVERRGMPTEVALLPMVESAFNPKAYSRAHASGLWQFIPSTGRSYGLQQNWWVDNRRDVIAATNAALDYLQKLHGMFGSWELALAAYNWGEGSVMRAINKNQAKGLPTDYLSLRMPKETQQYVPRLMAVKNLIQRPQDFGVELGVVPNTPYFAQITINRHIDVALAAKLADTTLDEFTSLNPNYTRPVIQAHQPTTLLLPVDKAENFAANLESYGKPLVSWQAYHAKRGEKIDAIAKRHGISGARLQVLNQITLKRGRLASNQTLMVPGAGNSNASAKLLNASYSEPQASVATGSAKTYTVRRGDTLLSIAKRSGVKTAQIKAWNQLSSNRLVLNQKLKIASAESPDAGTQRIAKKETYPATQKTAATKRKQYTVRRGDTLYSIAQRFDVDLDDLRRWNKLSSKARIHPGDKVSILLANNS